MNDKKVEGFRLVVEPSGKKRFGNTNRSRSRSRDNKRSSKHRRRRYISANVVHLHRVHLPPLEVPVHPLPIQNQAPL